MNLKTADFCDADPTARACACSFLSWGRARAFAGSIRTVRSDGDIGLIRQTLGESGAGCVLVIDGGGVLSRALFGDRMAEAAVRNGWAGVVVHGAVRDVAEIDGMALGVKALGAFPLRGTLGDGGQVDQPVHFGGIDFVPGQWLVADDDGVIVLPAAPSTAA